MLVSLIYAYVPYVDPIREKFSMPHNSTLPRHLIPINLPK